MTRLTIATRESLLALWQAQHVQGELRRVHPGLHTELLPMTTTGDQLLDLSLATAGGKGLFLKELERALLDERAHIAVHSMKDVPGELPPGLCISAVLERADPYDAFVSNTCTALQQLPPGARVGTSSLRRQAQLRAQRDDLEVLPLRGNLQTRLKKLDDGHYDAIILAAAGLKRLGLQARIAALMPAQFALPAVGQGVIGVECREDDQATRALLSAIEHPPTRACLDAERAFGAALEASCHSPVAAFAQYEDGDDGPATLTLRGMVAHPMGTRVLSGETSAPVEQATDAGRELAQTLLDQGAGDLLAAAHSDGNDAG